MKEIELTEELLENIRYSIRAHLSNIELIDKELGKALTEVQYAAHTQKIGLTKHLWRYLIDAKFSLRSAQEVLKSLASNDGLDKSGLSSERG